MPEIIEPGNPDGAADEIAALQDVPTEAEDVQAHGISQPGGPLSCVSTVECP